MITKTKPKFYNSPNTRYVINDKEVWDSRSASIVVVFLCKYRGEIYTIVEKRSDNMPEAAGKHVVPGGYFDWNEGGWGCVRREVYEETSLFIDDYYDYMIFNNDRQPFHVTTNVLENRQNIVLNYCIIFDFSEIGLPDIEDYKNEEVEKVEWVNVKDISNERFHWAFLHNVRIEQAISKFKEFLK